MLGELLTPELEELVAQRDFRQLKQILAGLEPADLAELVSDLERSDLAIVFRLLPKELATEVFEYLKLEDQQTLLKTLRSDRVQQLLDDMSPDDRTSLLEELPPRAASQLIQMLSPGERRVAQALLNYPEESVGRLMTTDFIYLRPEMTVKRALKKIRRMGIEGETVYALYVIDRDRKLIGVATLASMVTARLDTLVGELMDENVISVGTDDDREDVAEQFRKYDFLALPVVDSDARLVGIVTVDDVMDVIEAEHTEDVQLQAAVLPDEESYGSVGVWALVRRRAPWLLGLLLVEMVGVLFLRMYDATLSAYIALAFFMPVMIATGGNSGTQSAALLVRALAVGDVAPGNAARLVLRDFVVGCVLAMVLGGFAGLLAITINADPMIGVCVGLGLAAIIVLSNLAGTVLPMVFDRMRLDPALMSAPFITTLVDVLGLVIYMEISVFVLGLGG